MISPNKTIMDCPICFLSADYYIECTDNKCSAHICINCIDEYFNYCLSEKLPPGCIDSNCDEWYLYSSLSKTKVKQVYEDLIFEYYLQDRGSEVDTLIKNDKLVKALRDKRMLSLKNNFADTINLVAQIAFYDRLKRITNRNKTLYKMKNGRNCFNLVCVGVMDKKMKCKLCKTSFCPKCEKIIGKNHKCNKNDIDTIRMLKNDLRECPECKITTSNDVCPMCKKPIPKFTPCPKCNTIIYKFEGCDGMTCAVCKTNFNYETGEITSGGSFNEGVTIIKHIKLSGIFQDKLEKDLLEKILEFEQKRPKILTDSAILNIIKKVKINKVEPRIKVHLCKKVELYKRSLKRYHNYVRIANELEFELAAKNVDESKVLKLVKMF